jgi:hypothetical protein
VAPGQAAKQLWVNRRTAYNWINGEKVGRPAFLNEVHKKHLIGFYDDSLSALPDQSMDSLTIEFADSKIREKSCL